jgi:hypothetical protein
LTDLVDGRPVVWVFAAVRRVRGTRQGACLVVVVKSGDGVGGDFGTANCPVKSESSSPKKG